MTSGSEVAYVRTGMILETTQSVLCDHPRLGRVAAWLLAFALALNGCSTEGDPSGGSGGVAGNTSADGSAPDATPAEAGSNTGGAGGAGGAPDPRCAQANPRGFFPDCSLCGPDCDIIDDGTATYRACGCNGGCPCGLRCGSYEIAPNVVVSDICVR